MKKLLNEPDHWNNLIKQSDLEKFERKISLMSINEELIQFLEKTIGSTQKVDSKILYLYYAKKVLMHCERKPDAEHFKSFFEFYKNDRENFDPLKWLEIELDFWNNIKVLTAEQKSSSEIAQAKLSLSKQWLTQEEAQEMFKFSRTTINRRIAEGMPFHQKGKSKFFNLEEVGEWLKDDEAA